MKIVFMGTPVFAKTVLESLSDAGHEIVAVYTQPDKPQGRKSDLIASPVKEYAVSKGYSVYQPTKIKVKEEVDILKSFDADIYVVAAFGQFLSEEILNIPKFGCVNVHASLLPRYRGASPIQRSIVNGDEYTGVTIMQMDKGMDSGDIISQEKVDILRTDNEKTMYEKLASTGAKLLLETLDKISKGEAQRTVQDESLVTVAPMLKKEDGLLNTDESAYALECRVRGLSEWPVAYMNVSGKNLKVYEALAHMPSDSDYDELSKLCKDFKSGCFVVTKKKLYVTTGEGLLELISVQPEGKKRMGAADYMNGQHPVNGMSLQ